MRQEIRNLETELHERKECPSKITISTAIRSEKSKRVQLPSEWVECYKCMWVFPCKNSIN